ncbi:MAG: hypothetical protein WCB27_02635 [Thermoguttaceae bacterium]
MHHTHEEIREAFLKLLKKGPPNNYGLLPKCLAKDIVGAGGTCELDSSRSPILTPTDQDTLQDVFWELFHDGVITLGYPQQKPEFPYFHVSPFGKRVLENPNTYFFHDLTSYEKTIRTAVPDINETTLLYLKEAMQAYRSDCFLSATVMLGVAAEHTFDLLMDVIDATPPHDQTFAKVKRETKLFRRMNTFNRIISGQSLPPEVKEDLDIRFAGILSVIRESRNESGHPTGKTIDREATYGLLCLFPSFCKKMYQLRRHFSGK